VPLVGPRGVNVQFGEERAEERSTAALGAYEPHSSRGYLRATLGLLRGFLIGLLLVPVFAITLLSIRPGGLRNQLRNVARRLKLALILGGIYIGVSAAVRLLLAGKPAADFVTIAVALILTVVFVFLGQDRQLER
jgi:hypothetical protein